MRPRRSFFGRLAGGLFVFASEAIVVIAAILFAAAVAAIVLAIR
jgi:hypothetical protein